MSAHDQMRAMLDQLMGTARNGEVNPKIKYYDPKVCKSFLLGCCPHDILASTRMDIGECPKHHDLALRADYEQAAKNKDHYYDIDAMEHLQSFINDCDRRTEVAKKRLAETQEELSAEVAAKANKVHELAEQIGKNLAKAEELGAEGHVEESMKLMEEVEEIRKKKAQAEQDYRNSMPASSYQQQKLRVCEVCSAYLGIHDNDRRLADHFGGKLHLGFIKIREKLEELRITVEERREKRRIEREKERELAEKEREKTRLFEDRERERLRCKAKDDYKRRRSSSRERISGRKERSHSRSSSKSHKHRRKSRSRSKSRRSRSKSQDRKKSYRSRSRERHQRDKYKEEKHKHRSHKRKHECENGETKKDHHKGSTDGHMSQEDSAKEEGEWSHMESGEN